MTTSSPNGSAVLDGVPGPVEYVPGRTRTQGSRVVTIADMATLLRDTKGGLLVSGGLLIAAALGFTAIAAGPAGRWAPTELSCLGPLGLLALLVWLRAATLLALADRPVADTLGLLRRHTGAPLDLSVPWVPYGLDRLTVPDPRLVQALIAAARERQARAQLALRWAVIAASGVCLWSVLVIAWTATG
jgi:hypothetical protein